MIKISNSNNSENIDKSVFGTKLKYALVCVATLDDIDKLNTYIAQHPEIKPIYQKVSVNYLRILEE